MEGKAILLKRFANVDAFPLCLDTKSTDEIVSIVKALAPTFGGVNLEDILHHVALRLKIDYVKNVIFRCFMMISMVRQLL
ncbi:hypothetical protein LSPH24S_08162 [Lysinibacillus sphaericus]